MLISVWIFQRWRARRLETQNVIQEQGENKIGKGGYKQTRFIFFSIFSLIPSILYMHITTKTVQLQSVLAGKYITRNTTLDNEILA